MATHARLIALLGTLLAIGALAPVSGALASSTPAPVVAAQAPAAVCPLKANAEITHVSVITPTAIDVLANDCVGAATVSRPLTITAVTQGSYGAVTHDGLTAVYNPTACRTGDSDGFDSFGYTISDGVMTKTGTAYVVFDRPAAAPVSDVPTAGFISGSTIATTIPLKVSWCGVPASGSSVRSYRVEQSTTAGSTFSSVITSATTGTSSTRSARLSTSYVWRIRTTDSKSRVGAYSKSLVTRVGSVQDSGGKFVYSYGWKTASSSKYSGGKEHYVARTGATATLTVTNVRQFAVVSSRGAGRGSFNVYVDGKRVTTSAISQRSSSASWRRVLYVGGIPGSTAGTHTIQVRTTSSARVDLDTILTLTGKPGPVVSFSTPLPSAAIVNGTTDSVAASSTSGLPVTLAVDTASWAACSLTDGVLAYHGRGTCTVRATQAVDPAFDAASAVQTFTVAGLPQAITFDPLADHTYGDPAITLAATSDASPALTVAFSSQTPAVCSVSGTTATIVAAGTCTIRATQPGDATRAAATPVDQSFTVDAIDLTVTGVTAADRVYDGTTAASVDTTNAALVGILGSDDVTLVTTGATGAFDDAGVGAAKTVTVSGLTLAGARKDGYVIVPPTTTASISKADQVITFTSVAPSNPIKDGPTYTATATADSGLPVTITIDAVSSGVCSRAGDGVISFTGAGSCVVNADQPGDANHNAADRVLQNMTVASTGSTPQAITFTTPGPATYGDPAVALDAASDSLLPVTLISLDQGVCTISGATAVIVAAGDCRITASQAGDPTYAAAANVTRTLHVNTLAITVSAVTATKTYDGEVTSAGVPTITAGSLAAGDTGTWTQTYDTPAVGTGKTLTPAGTVHHGPNDVTDSYAITFATVSTGVVNPGAADTLTVSGFASPTVAGVAHNLTVTAKDAFGNTATGYTGTVHFTSTDGAAVLPANYQFLAGDNGVHTFTGLTTLKTAGTRSITATDTITGTITGTQGPITVNPSSATTLVVAASTPQVAGTPFTVTVTAKDAYGNTATGYTGTVHFTGTDGAVGASVPADYTFTGGDAGVRVFTNGVVQVTAAAQTITAADTITPSINGNTGPITINPAPAASFTVAATSPQVSGTPFTVTVTAKDGFGNTATGYTGTVHFTSTDGAATLPADYTFSGGDAGVHAFATVALAGIGSRDITVTDTVDSGVTGTRAGITVTPGAATQLTVSGFPASAAAGSAHTVVVTAKDAAGNTATGYTGTVHLSSTDGQAIVPADYTFLVGDGGVKTFTNGVTLKTAGTQSITATDTGAGSITGTQGSITVTPLVATHLTVAGFPTSVTAGTAGTVTVTARDLYENTATAYTGTVHFTSTDAQAVLPVNASFLVGDAGVKTFTNGVTLKTAGSRAITATDTVTGSINGTQGSITVSAAAIAGLTVTAPTPQTAGTPFTVTVTAADAFGNAVPGYTGRIHLATSDGGAVTLPGDYTFTGGDAGVHAFTNGATLVTSGPQTISAADTVNGSITGTSAAITVNPAAAIELVVSGHPASTVAGTLHPVTVTARDQYGNTATTYAGTVHLTSGDTQATLGADNTLLSGTRNFNVTLKTAGTQAVVATDTVQSGINGTQSGITVTAAAAADVAIEDSPTGSPPVGTANVQSGSSQTFYANSVDAFGNFVANVTATWTLTNKTGGVVNGDLVPAGDTKSAVLTGAIVGTATVHAVAVAGNDDTGTISVIAGPTATVTVEDANTGLGSPVGPLSLASGSSVTVYPVSRDAAGNFVGVFDSSFALVSKTGGVVNGDLTTPTSKSAVFTANLVGSAVIEATTGAISGDSGTITVTPGAASLAASTITAAPASLTGDGITTSEITVVLRDAAGNALTASGGSVTLNLAGPGSLGAVTNNGDGTYTATYTSDIVVAPDSAVITGLLGAQALADDATITLTP